MARLGVELGSEALGGVAHRRASDKRGSVNCTASSACSSFPRVYFRLAGAVPKNRPRLKAPNVVAEPLELGVQRPVEKYGDHDVDCTHHCDVECLLQLTLPDDKQESGRCSERARPATAATRHRPRLDRRPLACLLDLVTGIGDGGGSAGVGIVAVVMYGGRQGISATIWSASSCPRRSERPWLPAFDELRTSGAA